MTGLWCDRNRLRVATRRSTCVCLCARVCLYRTVCGRSVQAGERATGGVRGGVDSRTFSVSVVMCDEL